MKLKEFINEYDWWRQAVIASYYKRMITADEAHQFSENLITHARAVIGKDLLEREL